MANFVLTQVAPGVWTGPKGASVTAAVTSVSANATKLNSAAYPSVTPLVPNAKRQVTFPIASDGKPHSLVVDIIPPAVLDDWFIVEVGQDGTTQVLAGFVAGTPIGAVLIQPS